MNCCFKKKIAWHFDIHIHMLNVYIRYAQVDTGKHRPIYRFYSIGRCIQTISHRTEIKTGVTPYLRLTTQVFGNTGSEVSRKSYGRFTFYFDFLPFLRRCGEFRFVFELKIPMITSSNQCYDTYCRVDTEKSRNKHVSCYTVI